MNIVQWKKGKVYVY